MNESYVPFKVWAERGEYPTQHALYNWTRPSETRDAMLKAGVIARVNGRWLFSAEKWASYCERSAAA